MSLYKATDADLCSKELPEVAFLLLVVELVLEAFFFSFVAVTFFLLAVADFFLTSDFFVALELVVGFFFFFLERFQGSEL